MDSKDRVVAIVSGGMDSATLLYHLRELGMMPRALSFDYGQRHRKELEFARKLCDHIEIHHEVVDLRSVAPLFAGNCALTNMDVEVPHGHYEDESMKVTVVPNRNMIMLSLAAGHAVANECGAVAFGAHGGDHAIYPDCRSAFVDAMGQALALCDWQKIELLAPFLSWSKTDIARRGDSLRVPFEVTWSCYEGGESHCGRCGTCTERREAFRDAHVADPTWYAA